MGKLHWNILPVFHQIQFSVVLGFSWDFSFAVESLNWQLHSYSNIISLTFENVIHFERNFSVKFWSPLILKERPWYANVSVLFFHIRNNLVISLTNMLFVYCWNMHFNIVLYSVILWSFILKWGKMNLFLIFLQIVIIEHKSIICPGYNAVLHIHTCIEEVEITVSVLKISVSSVVMWIQTVHLGWRVLWSD